MGEIAVTYHAQSAKLTGKLAIERTGVALNFGRKRSGSYGWDEVRRISFDDPGRTRASVGAIAVFGVLGLAARRSFSLITLSVTDQDLCFTTPFAIGQVRATAHRIADDVPEAAAKLYVDGRPVTGAESQPEPARDPVEQIRQLGELHAAGLLTDDEFAAKKQEMLRRL